MIFVEYYQQIVARFPDRIAIVENGRYSISHQELWKDAHHIAHYFASKGITQGDRIGLYLPKSIDLLSSTLALWLLGAVFVPLDPQLPRQRLLFYASNAELKWIVFRRQRFDIKYPAIELRRDTIAIKTPVFTDKHSPAYLLYSSGSTGQPKGVLVSHRGIVPMTIQQIAAIGITEYDRSLWYLSMQFDASISDIAVALLSGSCLCIEDNIQSTTCSELIELLERRQINYIDIPPRFLSLLQPEQLPRDLRCLLIGGEVCPALAIQNHAEHRRILVSYGPTEATVCTSLQQYPTEDTVVQAEIGQPLQGIEYRIENAINGIGELYIAGEQLALEYWRHPQQSKERFVSLDHRRYFRTGDLVEYTDDTYVFHGRLDRQFKITGKIVSPEEVEAVLQRYSYIQEAAVLCKKIHDRQRLIAYVSTNKDTDPAQIITDCQQALPNWLIPSHIEYLSVLPKNTSGKIDYQQLQTRDLTPRTIIHPPISREEQLWATLLCPALGIEIIGVQENIFELGLDSLGCLEVITHAEQLGYQISLSQLRKNPTISSLVKWNKGSQSSISTETLRTLAHRYPRKSSHQSSTAHHCVLTGATGFLGGHLLAELLSRNRPVHCLVRGHNNAQARQRVLDNLNNFALPEPQANQLIIHLGDLTDSSNQWMNDLPDGDIKLFHCAAEISLLDDLVDLQDVNVTGFTNLFRHGVEIHYASTLAVLVAGDNQKSILREQDSLDINTHIVGGYAQSKWLAEWIAARANSHIYRLGLLTASTTSFLAPQRDWLTMTIKGMLKLRIIPAGEVELHFDLTPIDYASAAFIDIALNQSPAQVYHINAPQPASLSQLLQAFRRIGQPIRECSISEFLDSHQQFSDLPEVQILYLAFCRRLGTFSELRHFDLFLSTNRQFDDQNTKTYSRRHCPEPTIEYLAMMIESIISEHS